jgi:hypothetical protein
MDQFSDTFRVETVAALPTQGIRFAARFRNKNNEGLLGHRLASEWFSTHVIYMK